MTWITVSNLCIAAIALGLLWHAVDFYFRYAKHARLVKQNRVLRFDQERERRREILARWQAGRR